MLIARFVTSNISWGVWKIEESVADMSLLLNYDYKTDPHLKIISNEEKLSEKLAVRILLKELTGTHFLINYTDSGKPFLNNDNFEISFSHTNGYVAVAISETKGIKMGIDIEKISDKVKKVEAKFINETEYIDRENETIHLLLHWSAKESIYKAINKKGIDFRNDITVRKFSIRKTATFEAESCILPNRLFEILYETTDNYVLTLAYLKKEA